MKKIILGLTAILSMSSMLFAEENSLAGEFNQLMPEYSSSYNNQNRFGVGLGLGVSSKIYKTEDTNVMPLPMLDIRYGNFYAEGLTLGYNAYKNDILAMSIFLDPLAGFPIDGGDMKRGYRDIEDRETQAMIGLKADFKIDRWGGKGAVSFKAGEHGSQAKASIYRVFPLERFTLIPSLYMTYYTADFTDYYFGISKGETLRPGNNALRNKSYDAEGAFSVGMRVTGNYALNENLSLLIFLGVERLSDEINDSPLVENSTIYMAGAGAKYFF